MSQSNYEPVSFAPGSHAALTPETDHDLETAELEHETTEDDVPSNQKGILTNSYIGTARFLSYILIAIAALSLAMSGYVVHRAMTDGSPTIVPSFVLTSGDCTPIQRLNQGLLFLLNVIGGVCLAISNYLQQLCTSPTHQDVTSEMRKRGDVNFGDNSPSSLFQRLRTRKIVCVLWLILLITSLPLHLLLNGSIGVAPTLLSINVGAIYPLMVSEYIATSPLTFTNITNQTCLSGLNSINLQYSALFTPDNIILARLTAVINPIEWDQCSDYLGLYILPFSAVNVTELSTSPSWNESDSLQLVEGLITCPDSIEVPEQCGLVVRWLPCVIFSASLAFKAIIVCISLYSLPHFKNPLYNNIGDFIYFAINNPEYTVPNESLLSRRKRKTNVPTNLEAMGIKATLKHKPWAWFLSIGDWLSYVFWILGVGGMWFLFGYNYYPSYGQLMWSQPLLGLGGVTASTDWIIELQWSQQYDGISISSWDILQAVVVANLTQLYISGAYLLFNNQITRLWREREWRGFYRNRKKPRTAIASGVEGTRHTRWLQLPYSLSALMMAVSICLHWIASQALFLVESYDDSFHGETLNFYLLPLPTLVLASIWTALVLTITVLYLIPQRSPMPVMCGSGRVVLAACWRLRELPSDGVMWGDITEISRESSTQRKAGFSRTADNIVEGAYYL